MKRISLTILILTLITAAAIAAPRPGAGAPQPQQQGPGGAGEILPPPLLAQFLGLTEAQIAQVTPLRETLRATVEPLRDQMRENQEQIRAAVEAGNAAKAGELMVANYKIGQQIKAAHDAFQSAFEAILTSEQKAKLAIYEEIVALRRSARDRERE